MVVIGGVVVKGVEKVASKVVNGVKSLSKGLGGNPFKGKTEKEIEIEKMFTSKGFEFKGVSNAKGGYVNNNTGRSYHIDFNNRFGEVPHVDINPANKSNALNLNKKKYFTNGSIETIIK